MFYWPNISTKAIFSGKMDIGNASASVNGVLYLLSPSCGKLNTQFFGASATTVIFNSKTNSAASVVDASRNIEVAEALDLKDDLATKREWIHRANFITRKDTIVKLKREDYIIQVLQIDLCPQLKQFGFSFAKNHPRCVVAKDVKDKRCSLLASKFCSNV